MLSTPLVFRTGRRLPAGLCVVWLLAVAPVAAQVTDRPIPGNQLAAPVQPLAELASADVVDPGPEAPLETDVATQPVSDQGDVVRHEPAADPTPAVSSQTDEPVEQATVPVPQNRLAEPEPALVSEPEPAMAAPGAQTTRAENVDLKQVVSSTEDPLAEPEPSLPIEPVTQAPLLSAADLAKQLNTERQLLGVAVSPGTATRLAWTPSKSFSGIAVDTPVLVVNGKWDGPTLCLTAAVHGDELNGIEMVRQVLYELDPAELHGMVVGVPIVNLLGFSRNSRYLPDRRDLNRYFPGNPKGSVASRMANAFFNDVIRHCNALVDLHTGSFYRTNIPQLRANMRNPAVAAFTELFGDIPVLNTAGNKSSLRAAAVRAGIPAVTLEAGEPMRMQPDVVKVGVKAIRALMDKNGMYPSFSLWAKPSPAFYRSAWVRANSSGILFSRVELGGAVKRGDLLGEVINPITNERKQIVSNHQGRVLGMALDQFVLPGFAAYHIGIREARQLQALPAEPEEFDDDEGPETQPLQPDPETKPLTPEEEGFDDE